DLITPDLRQALQSAGPAGDVSVIINLAYRVDLKKIAAIAPDRIAGSDKVRKRDAIIKALREKASLTQKSIRALLQNRGAKKIKPLWITNSVAATVPASVISELMSLPEIESIELDAVVQASPVIPAAAVTPSAGYEWNISTINAPVLWGVGINGPGAVVANLDTGVDVSHPDLQNKWRGGSDSWYNPYADPANCCYCSNAPLPLTTCLTNCVAATACTSCELSATTPCDNNGHGTGTMGVMVGGSATDAYGVAPGAQWIAAKIFNDAGTTDESKIILAMQWLLAPGGNAANAPDIVNNSWGFNAPGQCFPALPNALEVAIQNVQASGIAMVFSAGNKGPNPSTSVSPANYPGSFAVGATDGSNLIAWFSSRGPSACLDRTASFPNVVAPGLGIYTSAPVSPGPSYVTVQGTSFSAPHVAGAEALLISAFPTLTPDLVETALEQTAVNIGAPASVPNITYGYGLIDVNGALSYLTSHGEISIPEIVGYPASFDYGTVDTSSPLISQTFTITNRSAASITVNSITVTGLNGRDFLISSNTCSGYSLAPLASCTFIVTPTSTGPKIADISINYGSSPAYNVPLSGNITTPVARVQSSTVIATYSLIQTAYNKCAGGEIVGMQATTYYESPNFNSPLNISVSLQGGYDASFGYQYGFTTLQGSLTISSGTVTVGNLILQ
ncbi:MAG: S8 family serine peptidase, partial [Nitrospiraceae bacterium]|nr:S8 family serine peptidase [Nitrospiraceae bacterium]